MSNEIKHESKLFVTMAERLDLLRKELKLTWGEFEDYLEISHTMMHFMRKEERNPSMKLLRRIEDEEKNVGIIRNGKEIPLPIETKSEPNRLMVRETDELLNLLNRVESVESELRGIKKGLKKLIEGG